MKKKRVTKLLVYVMKITSTQLLLICLFAGFAYGRRLEAQTVLNKTITISAERVELKKVISLLQTQTGSKFIYSSHLIHADRKISCNLSKVKVKDFFEQIFKPLGITYHIDEEKILLFPATEKESLQKEPGYDKPAAEPVNIKGTVKNAAGVPLVGVTVQLTNSKYVTTTDSLGNYELKNIPSGNHTITFTYVGYLPKKQHIIADNNAMVNASLIEDLLKLDDVVVTGTGNPKKKIESSVAITTRSSRDIALQAPLNSADLLKAVPGLSAESSGGDGPGSIRVRGLPGGGYIYLGIMEDGLPILPTGYSSLPSADQYFKYDLTIKNVEAIRGGNASIITSNTPGAVINNLSYTGGSKPYGSFKLTSGLSQGLYRVDANTGGQFNKDWQYNIGGFYRTDPGIKEPSFTANQGGQLKLNITRKLGDKGYIRFFGKYLNDKVEWLLPGYYGYDKNSHLSNALPYFDNFTEVLMPFKYQFNFTIPGNKAINVDLSDGFHTKTGYSGMLFHYRTNNDWTINNNFRYQATKMSASSIIVTTPAAFKSGINYYYAGGQPLQNPSGFYTAQQIGNTKRNDKQIIDYLDFTKKAGAHNITLGAGLYVYDFNSEGVAATVNTEIKNNPSVILVGSSNVPEVKPVANTSKSGYTKFDGISNMYSAYISDLVRAGEKWNFDGGLRLDANHLSGHRAVYGGSSASTGGSGYTIDGFTPFTQDMTYWSASLGINYKLDNHTGLFARGTKTYNAFTIDDFAAVSATPSQLRKRNIYMGELGLRYAYNKLAFFTSLSYSSVNNFPLTISVPGAAPGTVIPQATFGSSRTYSWETEIIYEVLKGLTLRGMATIENAQFTSYDIVVSPDADPSIAGKPLSWKGNRPERLPATNLQLSATYNHKNLNLYANMINIGSRWSTNANTYRLDGYTEMTAGVGYTIKKKVEIRFWGSNLLNARGLTEGNVRGEQFINESTLAPGQLMLGRAILPRSFWASISYTF